MAKKKKQKKKKRKIKASKGKRGEFAGVKEAAIYCRVSIRTIYYHVENRNIVQQPDGSFFKKDLDKYRAGSGKRHKRNGESPEDHTEKDKVDIRYRTARAEYQELMLEKEKEKLIPKSQAYEALIERAQIFRRGLDTFHKRLVNRIGVLSKKALAEVNAIIEEEKNKLLEEYSRPIDGIEPE